MKALRQILKVKNHSINIHLPDDFNAKEVEVIVLPLEEQVTEERTTGKLRGKLNLSDKQYNDFQEDVRKSREEW